MIVETYDHAVLTLLESSGVGTGAALDVASGVHLRHARILADRFERVVANELPDLRQDIEDRFPEGTPCEVLYGDFGRLSLGPMFDLVSLGWFEAALMESYIEPLPKTRDYLAENGRLLVTFREGRNASPEEAIETLIGEVYAHLFGWTTYLGSSGIDRLERAGFHVCHERTGFDGAILRSKRDLEHLFDDPRFHTDDEALQHVLQAYEAMLPTVDGACVGHYRMVLLR